jgi:hypothetical protein
MPWAFSIISTTCKKVLKFSLRLLSSDPLRYNPSSTWGLFFSRLIGSMRWIARHQSRPFCVLLIYSRASIIRLLFNFFWCNFIKLHYFVSFWEILLRLYLKLSGGLPLNLLIFWLLHFFSCFHENYWRLFFDKISIWSIWFTDVCCLNPRLNIFWAITI